jgi:hypothetical protein
LLLQNILESPHGVIFFSLDSAYRYTSFARAHAQTMKAIWGAAIEIGTCMLDVIRDDADRQKAKANFDAALSGQNILKEEEYGDASLQRTFWENRNLSTSLRQSAGFICEPFVGLLPRLTLPVLVAA